LLHSDYAYVLEKCYESQTPYIAVFEDDIIFADGWLIKTLKALEEIKLHAEQGEKFWNWVYLRLFYTETFFSWNADDDFWYANRYQAAFLAAVGGAAVMFGIRILIPTTKKMLDTVSAL
jgi:GR25 family glycosyltransferase involved in LPS biosynthesis